MIDCDNKFIHFSITEEMLRERCPDNAEEEVKKHQKNLKNIQPIIDFYNEFGLVRTIEAELPTEMYAQTCKAVFP